MPLSPPRTSERVPAHTTPRTLTPPFSPPPGCRQTGAPPSFPLRSVTCRPFVTRFSTCCRLVAEYHAHVASWRAKFARIENLTRGLGSHSGVATGPIPFHRVESWDAIDWQWESHFAVLYHFSYCMRRAGQAKAATSAAYLTAHAMTMPACVAQVRAGAVAATTSHSRLPHGRVEAKKREKGQLLYMDISTASRHLLSAAQRKPEQVLLAGLVWIGHTHTHYIHTQTNVEPSGRGIGMGT